MFPLFKSHYDTSLRKIPHKNTVFKLDNLNYTIEGHTKSTYSTTISRCN